MSDLRKYGATIYSMGSTIPDHLQKVALVGFTGDTLPPSILPAEFDFFTSPDQIPPDMLKVAALPYAYGAAIPAHLKQVADLGYVGKVLSVAPANLVSYWPLWDASGTSVVNLASLRGMPAAVGIPDATSVGVTLGEPGIGDGRTSYLFDGTNDYVNIHSPQLAAAFNGSEGTLMVWAKVANAGVWGDSSVSRYLAIFQVDINNQIYIRKNSAVPDQIMCLYIAGGASKDVSLSSMASLDWLRFFLTWSKTDDAYNVYLDGNPVGTASGLGVWTGSIARAIIGALALTPTNCWHGWLANVALWNTPLSAAQIAYLSRVR